MTKRLCDRCGRDITYGLAGTKVSGALNRGETGYDVIDADLCVACYGKLKKWIKRQETA